MNRAYGTSEARRSRTGAVVCAATIALTAWTGIVSEAMTSFEFSRQAGRTLLMSILFFYRYFTNQAVTILACVMTTTVIKLILDRDMLEARVYAAVLAYVAVMGTVYEALLRRLWSPTGFWFYRDALMHDVLPMATLIFWILFAPKKSLAWMNAIVWLSYPAAYLLVTLAVGQLSGEYPYPFLDPRFAGVATLLVHVSGLAIAFYVSGLAVIALSRSVR